MASSESDERAFASIVMETERRQDDPAGFADLLVEDAVLVNAVGRRVVGRAAIQAAMEAAVKTPLVDVRTRHELVSSLLLREDVALVSMRKHVSSPADAGVSTGSQVESTLVLVKRGDVWLIAAAHNTLVRA